MHRQFIYRTLGSKVQLKASASHHCFHFRRQKAKSESTGRVCKPAFPERGLMQRTEQHKVENGAD